MIPTADVEGGSRIPTRAVELACNGGLWTRSLALALAFASALGLAYTSGAVGDVSSGHQLISRASQTLSEAAAPCTATCDIVNTTVFYAIKTSSKAPYVVRATEILSTWGRWCSDRIALISDDSNISANARFQDLFTNVSIVVPPDVENFGDYHTHYTEEKYQAAWRAQRKKTRTAIRHFLDHRTEKYLCYFDDDMYVHVPNLEYELSQRFSQCEVCMTAAVWFPKTGGAGQGRAGTGRDVPDVPCPGNGWCMTRPFALDFMRELDKPDARWNWTDDGGLGIFMHDHGMILQDSRLWCGQGPKLVDEGPDGLRKIGLRMATREEEWFKNASNTQNASKLVGLSVLHVNKLLQRDMYDWHEFVNNQTSWWRSSCNSVCPTFDVSTWRAACGEMCAAWDHSRNRPKHRQHTGRPLPPPI